MGLSPSWSLHLDRMINLEDDVARALVQEGTVHEADLPVIVLKNRPIGKSRQEF
jgi:hypothetical protein